MSDVIFAAQREAQSHRRHRLSQHGFSLDGEQARRYAAPPRIAIFRSRA